MFYTIDDIKNILKNNSGVLIDVRDKDSFIEGHIPGAKNIPEIFTYLSMSTEEGLYKKQKTFTDFFINAGISNEKPVIFYSDCLSAAYGAASRGYLILTYLGHENAGIYPGGLNEWLEREEELAFGDIASEKGNFTPNIKSDLLVTKEEVLNAIDTDTKLLDDRDEAEWEGLSSSPYGVDFAPRKGRIKGAKWIAWHKFLHRKGNVVKFQPKEVILRICQEQNITPEDEVIIYCFKGSRASNTYLAMKTAGFKNLKVYFASWNEWSRDPSLPIEE